MKAQLHKIILCLALLIGIQTTISSAEDLTEIPDLTEKVEEDFQEAPLLTSSHSIQLKRISGRTRYETAVKISQETFTQADRAIIAYGENFPDAMFGGKLAVKEEMPILLVQKNHIPNVVKDELERLGAERLYILGGEAAISKEVEREFLNTYSVKRIFGKNRFETAWNINMLVESLEHYGKEDAIIPPGEAGSSIIVSGRNFADALSAAPFVSQFIPSTGYDSYPRGDYRFLPYDPGSFVGNTGRYIIGGEAAVPSPEQMEGFGTLGIRIAGPNRYATAVEIAKSYPYFTGKGIDTVVLANGLNYPDALAAAPLVGSLNAALLLTHPDSLSLETKAYLQDYKIKNIILLGGDGAISPEVVQELESIAIQ